MVKYHIIDPLLKGAESKQQRKTEPAKPVADTSKPKDKEDVKETSPLEEVEEEEEISTTFIQLVNNIEHVYGNPNLTTTVSTD
jgi:hypothetical protein